MEPGIRALEIHQALLDYFGSPELPDPMPPMDQLISTILSQNTNDANRDRAFLALRRRFSTWEEVRDAEPAAVVEAIRPAGLANQKGPRIQEVLREITRQRGSLDLDFLSGLPPEQALSWLLELQRCGTKDCFYRAAFFIRQAGLPGGHAYLSPHRSPGPPARQDECGTGACFSRGIVSQRYILRVAS